MKMNLNKSFFTGIVDNWKKDFRENKLIFWLEMLGTLCLMLAGAVLAATAPRPNMLLAYSFYISGNGMLMVGSYMRSNGFWVILNVFFLCIDLFGVYNTLTA